MLQAKRPEAGASSGGKTYAGRLRPRQVTRAAEVAVNLSPIRAEDYEPLLPAQLPKYSGKHLLILDLDETLVHSSFEPVVGADMTIPVVIQNNVYSVYMTKRPH